MRWAVRTTFAAPTFELLEECRSHGKAPGRVGIIGRLFAFLNRRVDRNIERHLRRAEAIRYHPAGGRDTDAIRHTADLIHSTRPDITAGWVTTFWPCCVDGCCQTPCPVSDVGHVVRCRHQLARADIKARNEIRFGAGSDLGGTS